MQRALTEGLSGQTLAALERLVQAGPETVPSRLAWLRTASRSPAARNLLGLIERLAFVRSLGVSRTLQGAIPQVAFQRLVGEAMRMTAQHLAEATTSRRLALLVTVTLHLEAVLTDAALSMFDKLMGSLSRRAERRSEEQAARSAGDLRTRLRVLASGCRALIMARDANGDLEEAIELHMGWGRFIRVVTEAEAAAGPEAPDTKAELLSRYSTIRQFAPTLLLDAFQFRGGRTAAGLLRAIEIVRELNRTGQRALPAQVPTGFIRRIWRPLVLRQGGVDRRAYEVCVLCELRDRLRAGDVWVDGSRASEAPHVLDGLLYHETGLQIVEHYTDTGGATDHVFGLCALLGFRFAPRLRDIKDRRLYVLPGQAVPAVLQPLTGGAINASHVEQHWDELLRMATSIRAGTVAASTMLKRLAVYPRQNGLAIALREVGRIERTLFALSWMRDIDLRRRVSLGLNKGEARNALARAVFFHRLGELRDRSFESQAYRASGLNLLVAAIILWNTKYLENTLHALRAEGQRVPIELARHLAPLGWEHVSLTGEAALTSLSAATSGRSAARHPYSPPSSPYVHAWRAQNALPCRDPLLTSTSLRMRFSILRSTPATQCPMAAASP